MRVSEFEDCTGNGNGVVCRERDVLNALLSSAFGLRFPVGDCDAGSTYVKVSVLHSVPEVLVALKADLGGGFDAHLFSGDFANARKTVTRMTAVEATPRRPRKVTASPVKVRVSGVVICCL